MRAAKSCELYGEGTYAAARSGDEDALALRWLDRLNGCLGCGAGNPEGGCLLEPQARRLRRDGDVRRNGNLLGERSDAKFHAGDETEDGVADGEGRRVCPRPCDDAGEVSAENDREVVLHHPFGRTAGDENIEAVDRRGANIDQDLTGAGSRFRDLSKPNAALVVVHNDRSHTDLLPGDALEPDHSNASPRRHVPA
jgi:hypothetical protein